MDVNNNIPSNKLMCKYCTKYNQIPRNGINLQGNCMELNRKVWKDEYCTDHKYNGK